MQWWTVVAFPCLGIPKCKVEEYLHQRFHSVLSIILSFWLEETKEKAIHCSPPRLWIYRIQSIEMCYLFIEQFIRCQLKIYFWIDGNRNIAVQDCRQRVDGNFLQIFRAILWAFYVFTVRVITLVLFVFFLKILEMPFLNIKKL